MKLFHWLLYLPRIKISFGVSKNTNSRVTSCFSVRIKDFVKINDFVNKASCLQCVLRRSSLVFLLIIPARDSSGKTNITQNTLFTRVHKWFCAAQMFCTLTKTVCHYVALYFLSFLSFTKIFLAMVTDIAIKR